MIDLKMNFRVINKEIETKLNFIYKNKISKIEIEKYSYKICNLINQFNKNKNFLIENKWSQETFLLISYADNLIHNKEKPIKTLEKFLNKYFKKILECVHILPFYPSSGDGGFSVTNHYEVDNNFGNWKDITKISKRFKIMADIVINHASIKSDWFQNYLKDKNPGKDYFISIDKTFDTSKVVRPRDHDLIQKFKLDNIEKNLWCTFSKDQVDLNFKNPEVLMGFLEILFHCLKNGINIFRLDAVGFIWKENGTECLNLPETHEVIKLIRKVLDSLNQKSIIVTETNLPRKENLSYFGNNDEAHWIYNFTLPPLLVHTLLFENSNELLKWSKSMPPAREGNAYLNFISSHDGIGMRPVEGILNESKLKKFFNRIEKNGGTFSYRKITNRRKVYEANISLFDALKKTDFDEDGKYSVDRFLCAHIIMFSLEGIPAVYFNSFFGTSNDNQKFKQTGIKRDLNRHKWCSENLNKKLSCKTSKEKIIFNRLKEIIDIRKKQDAFHPNATQFTLQINSNLFSLWRQSIKKDQSIFSISNVTSKLVDFDLDNINLIHDEMWIDLFNPSVFLNKKKIVKIKPYQTLWITNKL